MEEHVVVSLAQYQKLKAQLAGLRQYLLATGVADSDLDGEAGIKSVVKQPSKRVFPQVKGIPKGDHSWDLYSRIGLREIGGSGKAIDVAKYMREANPKTPFNVIVDNVRSALHRQSPNVIDVEKGASKQEGNTYKLRSGDLVYQL